MHRTSSTVACQILAGACLLLAAAPALADDAGSFAAPKPYAAAPPAKIEVLLKRLSEIRLFGSASLNWRNVGPRTPGFETQIQNEVYLADMYFGAEGPALEGVPFHLEMNVPTALQGQVQLYQMFAEYDRVRRIRLQAGKFLVPFGRYNELYRPDQFLTVTRPLLFASPDSIDLVVRPNSPRPPVSAGYTDIGGRFSWYPVRVHPLIPDEITVFVVNGLGESTNRSRAFPNPQNLGIPGPPTNGVTDDFGHQNNNLADNNNDKAVGGRVVFALGDMRLPFPIPERDADLDGVLLGLSGMGSKYDLEGNLGYEMWDLNWSFQYQGVSFSGEAEYSEDQFLNPLINPATGLPFSPAQQIRLREEIYGYYAQAAFPIMRNPPFGRRLTGVLVFNQLYRRGPALDFLLNYTDPASGSTFPSLTAARSDAVQVQTQIDKYTGALNYQLSEHFALKFDYSYWVMSRATVRSATSLGYHDVYQGALSLVMGF
ncbi:MAG TPA: hypothetical protein VN915_15220 [Elusimicrobiota bacterium]|nr:hypothetical protein [Elusimicrobiota bacterium]